MWYALHPDEARYIGERLGSRRWEVIQKSDRVGIRLRVEKVHARGI